MSSGDPYLEQVQFNLARIHDRIAIAGADPDAITIVAVTKQQPAEAVDAALSLGLIDVGENRADALIDRAASHASRDTRWHYLGQVQRNKVRRVAPFVALWQSVDRAEVGAAIAARAPGAEVLVQVNLTDDPDRGGAAPDAVPALVRDLQSDGLNVRGLMAVGPLGGADAARPGFSAVVRQADELGLPVRSLGMSDDLEVAIACGSTMVRVGAALFGARPQSTRPRHLN
ncbi:MAG: dependent protein [Actinomycetota bacterium]|jgi:pyridoxal phosphate enzyme (YggS family)